MEKTICRLLVLASIMCGAGQVHGEKATFSFHVLVPEDDVVAGGTDTLNRDKPILKSGKDTRWLLLRASLNKKELANEGIVTRKGSDGRRYALAYSGGKSIPDSHIIRLSQTFDDNGVPGVAVGFDQAGATMLYKYTHSNIGNVVAAAVQDEVNVIGKVVFPVERFAIKDMSKQELCRLVAEQTGDRLPSGHYLSRNDEYGIAVTGGRLAVVAGILLVLVIGAFPAKGLQPSRKPRIWLIIGGVACAILGAYFLGLTCETTSGESAPGEPLEVQHTLTIHPVRMLMGIVLGSIIGLFVGWGTRFFVRRAIFNCRKAVIALMHRQE